MSSEKKLCIGLFGFGVVGEGIYEVLRQTPSLNAFVKKICIKNIHKERNAPLSLFTTDKSEILNDEEINLVVELINDADEAFEIVQHALRSKKAVVSANKKMIAENLDELLELQSTYDVPFLYEAAVCGSIPVIRNLEEYYDNDMLRSICGIVNGSTNFILSKILDEGQSYQKALCDAQAAGFAEKDPDLDVSGRDAVNKLTILLLHAYGLHIQPDAILQKGITSVHKNDAGVAFEKGYKIKLIAHAWRLKNNQVAAYVLPQFVTGESSLYNVRNEYNGVVIESKLADKQFLSGKGAGRFPTSSAVLSDIAALRYNYRYEYRKSANNTAVTLSSDVYLRVYVSFDDWKQVNKWDFESIEEFHSTEYRQYIIGIVHLHKLREASWLNDTDVSVILLPDAIVEKEKLVTKKLQKISLQLAGVV